MTKYKKPYLHYKRIRLPQANEINFESCIGQQFSKPIIAICFNLLPSLSIPYLLLYLWSCWNILSLSHVFYSYFPNFGDHILTFKLDFNPCDTLSLQVIHGHKPVINAMSCKDTYPFSLYIMSRSSRTRFSSSRTSSELLVEVEETLYRACNDRNAT